MQVSLFGKTLKNPLVLASGILGLTKESFKRIYIEGASAVTTKSLCHEERPGYNNPTMFAHDQFLINAVGLAGQGIDNAINDFGSFDKLKMPIIGSIFGYNTDQFGKVAKKMAALSPWLIEVNISCPHMDYDKPYYADEKAIKKITRVVKSNCGDIPIGIKLSPNVYNISNLAKAAQASGADFITAINTVNAMKIDIETGRPILSNKTGGMSGPALKPIAVRSVYEIYKKVDIPIIGTGGVNTGEDAIELIMAGATLVGVGSALYFRGIEAFNKIEQEMKNWLKKHNTSIEKIKSIAHE